MCTREELHKEITRSHTAQTKMISDFTTELNKRMDEIKGDQAKMQELVHEICRYLRIIAEKL